VYLFYNVPSVDGEVPYGEAVISVGYVLKHWPDHVAILDMMSNQSAPYQFLVVMRRR